LCFISTYNVGSIITSSFYKVTWCDNNGNTMCCQIPCPHSISKFLKNSASARPLCKKPHLVLKSMLVYIEVPTCLPPTMTATVAEGIHPNSAYHVENLPLTHENIKVMVVGVGFNSNTSPLIENSHSTLCNVQSCIADPTHAANFCSKRTQNRLQLWPLSQNTTAPIQKPRKSQRTLTHLQEDLLVDLHKDVNLLVSELITNQNLMLHS